VSFSPRAGIRGFDTYADTFETQTHIAFRRVSVPERGFVALILSASGHRDAAESVLCSHRSGFSPRAGIRGFDTSAQVLEVQLIGVEDELKMFQSPSGDSWL
jgi:hypothetical protein